MPTYSGLEYEDLGGVWSVHIRKPIFGTTVSINRRFLTKAMSNQVDLFLSCPGGEILVSPTEVLASGKKIKTVFRYADNPMVMIQYEVTPRQYKSGMRKKSELVPTQLSS